MLSIKVIVGKASEGTLEEKEAVSFSEANKLSLDEFAHGVLKERSSKLFGGVYDFSFSDGAMN